MNGNRCNAKRSGCGAAALIYFLGTAGRTFAAYPAASAAFGVVTASGGQRKSAENV
jgi:hypothetical protein